MIKEDRFGQNPTRNKEVARNAQRVLLVHKGLRERATKTKPFEPMHFPVTVITPYGHYHTALEPFSEHLEVEPYFDKSKQDLIAELRAEKAKAEKDKNESLLKFYSWAYRWDSDEDLFESIKEREEAAGFIFDDDGNRLSTYNKQGKWDWYVLGGRFSGMLITKKGKRVDEAQVKNIDFNAYKLSEKDNAWYTRQWEIIVEKQEPREGEEIEEYLVDPFTTRESLLTDFGTKERYLRICNSFFTHNLVYDGEWYRADEDSLFCNDPNRNLAYENKFFKIMSKLNPNDYISIVDCHA